jgi:hypothetical protein
MSKELELRMYGLVPYNISPIQQGIQFGHAVVEYGQMVKQLKSKNSKKDHFTHLEEQYDEWANHWKTFIILNGGTTNNRIDSNEELPFGTLNKSLITLSDARIDVATFSEPDLGDQLTAIVFIVDERVFNKKKYPDFEDWLIQNYSDFISIPGSIHQISKKIKESKEDRDQKVYKKWLKLIGGEKNEFLRKFLKDFKLA